MNSDKILLPAGVIADLYRDSLVVIDNEIESKPPQNVQQPEEPAAGMISVSHSVVETPYNAPVHRLAFLGENRQRISIIVNDEAAIHLQDEHLQILSAILGACRLNLADVAIVNRFTQEVSHRLLREELAPSIVLLFGVDTSDIELPFRIPEYHIQQFDGCSYLQSAPLAAMAGNTTDARMEKSRLWVSLKKIFGI